MAARCLLHNVHWKNQNVDPAVHRALWSGRVHIAVLNEVKRSTLSNLRKAFGRHYRIYVANKLLGDRNSFFCTVVLVQIQLACSARKMHLPGPLGTDVLLVRVCGIELVALHFPSQASRSLKLKWLHACGDKVRHLPHAVLLGDANCPKHPVCMGERLSGFGEFQWDGSKPDRLWARNTKISHLFSEPVTSSDHDVLYCTITIT